MGELEDGESFDIPDNEFDPSLDFDAETFQKMGYKEKMEYQKDLVRRREAAHQKDMNNMNRKDAIKIYRPAPGTEKFLFGEGTELGYFQKEGKYEPVCNVIVTNDNDSYEGTFYLTSLGGWAIISANGQCLMVGSATSIIPGNVKTIEGNPLPNLYGFLDINSQQQPMPPEKPKREVPANQRRFINLDLIEGDQV